MLLPLQLQLQLLPFGRPLRFQVAKCVARQILSFLNPKAPTMLPSFTHRDNFEVEPRQECCCYARRLPDIGWNHRGVGLNPTPGVVSYLGTHDCHRTGCCNHFALGQIATAHDTLAGQNPHIGMLFQQHNHLQFNDHLDGLPRDAGTLDYFASSLKLVTAECIPVTFTYRQLVGMQ